jgi:hypothetical protein
MRERNPSITDVMRIIAVTVAVIQRAATSATLRVMSHRIATVQPAMGGILLVRRLSA